MEKSIIYYTSNTLEEPLFSAVQKQILKSGLPIVSCSLKPIDFGKNIVLNREPSVITMFTQILTALEASEAKYVFFCEHDCLYPLSHFDFTPPTDDTYYYNSNVLRWDFPKDRLITYDGHKSLSGMCCNRELAIRHYQKRLALIAEKNWEDGREPNWARKIGYEPGKTKRRGGFMEEKVDVWQSEFPLIDIRHKGTLTPPKCDLKDFKHLPINWKETTFADLKGWNFKDIL